LDPAVTEALRIKGNGHIAAGRLDEAESCFRAALTHAPNSTQLLICLGYVLKEQGRLVESRIVLRRAAHGTGQRTAIYEAYYLLGQISEQQKDWDDALRQFTAALEHKPDFVQACTDGLRMLMAGNKKSDVPAFLDERIRQCPSEREYFLIAGRYCVDVSNNQGIVDNFAAAIALDAPLADINLPMGQALLRLYREKESRPFLESALVADPALAPYIDTVRAGYFGQLGDEAKAIALLENAIAANPNYGQAHSVLLMMLSSSTLDPQRIDYLAAAQRFAKTVESGRQLPDPSHHRLQPNTPTQALRVGFVAGEFKHHPVLHFLLGMLENLDAGRIRTVAFSNNVYDDSGTDILKNLFDEWVEIRDLDDGAAADVVRSHNIDILLDLCGHTGDSRLALFAQRPAPVQASWLGYWASTGLSTVDYIIADPICVPDGSSEWFSETVFYLPTTRLCMTAPRAAKPIPTASLPCLRNGYITFGSFQRTAKLNGEVLALWSRVLLEVPTARLRIQTNTVKTETLRDQLAMRIRDAGIDLSRLDLEPQTPADLYLAAHSEVDIILDTFPFTGGTTTAQALWMGVPTVTLAGNTMLSLQGASMLSCVGLTDWIAQGEDDYIRIACRFANDPQYLAQLRSELRDRALQSPLFDVKRFALNFTDALWDMYRKKMRPAEAS
jgi:predicted O-linked N-acetylglucosamine transferase (SPINDLY family)